VYKIRTGNGETIELVRVEDYFGYSRSNRGCFADSTQVKLDPLPFRKGSEHIQMFMTIQYGNRDLHYNLYKISLPVNLSSKKEKDIYKEEFHEKLLTDCSFIHVREFSSKSEVAIVDYAGANVAVKRAKHLEYRRPKQEIPLPNEAENPQRFSPGFSDEFLPSPRLQMGTGFSRCFIALTDSGVLPGDGGLIHVDLTGGYNGDVCPYFVVPEGNPDAPQDQTGGFVLNIAPSTQPMEANLVALIKTRIDRFDPSLYGRTFYFSLRFFVLPLFGLAIVRVVFLILQEKSKRLQSLQLRRKYYKLYHLGAPKNRAHIHG